MNTVVIVVLSTLLPHCAVAQSPLLDQVQATIMQLNPFAQNPQIQTSQSQPSALGPAAVSPSASVQQGANNRAEVVWRENFHMGINNGYAWFSYGPNTFMPKDKVQDPNWKYSDSGWTGLLLGSFTGKYGPFYYGIYALQGTYTLPSGKKLETGRIAQSWASHPMYCGPDSPFADLCTPSVWNWESLPNGCESLTIYDDNNRKDPLLKISRMCKIPAIYYPVPNTTWYFPRESAVRLFAMDVLTHIVDGYTSDGKAKVKTAALYDFDMEAIATPATYDKMEGTAVANFTQYLIPLGFNIMGGGSTRFGVFGISPNQMSF